MRLGFWLGLAALIMPAAAQAEWLQASSAHFVVYADDSERDIRTFSEQLERYHAALSKLTSVELPLPSPSNRLTVFVVKGQEEVRKLHGGNSRYIGAFYVPRAGSSMAIVPKVTTGTTDLDFSMTALLHEYAHHYMISASTFPMPRWYSEGGAEFFASAGFPTKGGVNIGRPAMHRAAELIIPGFARDVKVVDLLDPPKEDPKSRRYGAFYGKSWLLFHYLTFDKARSGQLHNYLRLIAGGKTSRAAGLEAFGDLDLLEKELDVYMTKRMLMLTLPPSMITTGPITIRKLTPGEAAITPIRIRSQLGVDEDGAKALLPQARAVAARFPDDPAVLSALAEAEHDAGNDKEAIAAADAAIAKNPGEVNAYIQKGKALFRLAPDAEDDAAAYSRARAAFVALNRREPDHPLPLIYYYRSFTEQGKTPSDLAFDGLARAAQVAPFDLGLRMTLASELARRRRMDEAKISLAPIAYNPHGGGLAAAAQRVLAKIEADPKWDGQNFSAVAGSGNEESE